MNTKSETFRNNRSKAWTIISGLFGGVSIAVGVVNLFWGNDLGFGVFLILLSLVYFPPMTARLKEKTGFFVPATVKILLGIFIIWAALGVGELFDKIDLMLNSLSNI